MEFLNTTTYCQHILLGADLEIAKGKDFVKDITLPFDYVFSDMVLHQIGVAITKNDLELLSHYKEDCLNFAQELINHLNADN